MVTSARRTSAVLEEQTTNTYMSTVLEKSTGMMSRSLELFVAAAVAASLQLLLPRAAAVVATDDVITLPGCTSQCGNISIPHPFGVEPGCYLPGLNVTCKNGSLFLGDGSVQVVEISIPNNTVRINASIAYFPGSNEFWLTLGMEPITSDTWRGALEEGGVYSLALQRNRMMVVGCNVQVFLVDGSNQTVSTCTSLCVWSEYDQNWHPLADSGVAFCEATVLEEGVFYSFRPLWLNMNGGEPSPRSPVAVSILDRDFDSDPSTSRQQPVVLDWRVLNHSTCHRNGSSASCRSEHSSCMRSSRGPDAHKCVCDDGYQGNPYIPNGCREVNECVSPETYPCYGVCNNTEGSYECKCPRGFEGNASLPNGCKDIDECAHPDSYSCYGVCTNMYGTFRCQCKRGSYGNPFTKGGCQPVLVWLGVGGGIILLLLVLGVPFIERKIKHHKFRRAKERFFKQNHGLLLQQLVSQKSDISGRMIIALGDLQKATNNFDPSHEVGGGGHGIVYKGLLDLHVVAIKKSKIIVQKEIDDFINEVVILSQINHRNIVKLLGCCLETEVPLLVYEFISNGTLAHHLHVEGISLPWDDRLRIALETSKALAYLHSAASTPILHRDIKSSNILLDDNLTAKVSDFGASRYISIDQTGVITAVQGTVGYLDPMYYYTSHLTGKSDVFSLGVLLIELLSRKRPTERTSDGNSPVSHFTSLIAEGDLVGIIDPQIMEEAEGEKVAEVAKLAAMCTKLNREDWPTMREVEMALENLRITKKHTRHNIATERFKKDQIIAPYISIEGLNVEASRQYTMEEEMLLSGTFPR